MDGSTNRLLAETERALSRYRRRLSSVLRDLRGFAVTEADLLALGRDSKLFVTAADRLISALDKGERTALQRLKTARNGGKLWHGLIARYGLAMRSLVEGPNGPTHDAVTDFVEQARLRRRFTRAAEARDARLRTLSGTLRKLKRKGSRRASDAPDGAPPSAPPPNASPPSANSRDE